VNIYSRLLKLYRTNMVKTPLEDFTTEILAGILDNNKELCNAFINEIIHIEGDCFEISTQERFLLNEDNCPDCRVDLVVRSKEAICFIENKVESREGYIQLERYGRVLDSYKSENKTYLRYCTKYHDNKDITYHEFLQFRWADVYKFLKDWDSITIIKDYLDFLNDHNMSDNMDFNFKDLIALQEMNQVVKKMDNYFDKIKPSFNKSLGYRLKDSTLLKQIKEHSRYILIMESPFGSGYSELGFGFKLSETPSLTVWIWCSDKSNKKEEFKKALNVNLNTFNSNKENWIGLDNPISNFLSLENMELAIEEWFIRSFEIFREFANQTPQLEWHLS
jgi:hypothetical protein